MASRSDAIFGGVVGGIAAVASVAIWHNVPVTIGVIFVLMFSLQLRLGVSQEVSAAEKE